MVLLVPTLLAGLLTGAITGDLWDTVSRGTTRGTAGCMRGGGVALSLAVSSRGFAGVLGADNRSGRRENL